MISNAVTETASGKTAAVPSSAAVGGNPSSNAYYLGTELAIRDYVLEFLAKNALKLITVDNFNNNNYMVEKNNFTVMCSNASQTMSG